MPGIISKIKEFEKQFPNAPTEGERRNALEKYFEIKGVIRAYPGEKIWPKLTYPNNIVISRKLKELKEKKSLYEKNLSSWNKKFNTASKYHRNNQIKKFKEPLYWKHIVKSSLNPDYRKDSKNIKMPVHLVADTKWKPMVKMFVNDLEYRKQLTETVSESIVYKNDRKVARYADELKDFRMETSNKQIVDIKKKIEKINEVEKALKEIQRWLKE